MDCIALASKPPSLQAMADAGTDRKTPPSAAAADTKNAAEHRKKTPALVQRHRRAPEPPTCRFPDGPTFALRPEIPVPESQIDPRSEVDLNAVNAHTPRFLL